MGPKDRPMGSTVFWGFHFSFSQKRGCFGFRHFYHFFPSASGGVGFGDLRTLLCRMPWRRMRERPRLKQLLGLCWKGEVLLGTRGLASKNQGLEFGNLDLSRFSACENLDRKNGNSRGGDGFHSFDRCILEPFVSTLKCWRFRPRTCQDAVATRLPMIDSDSAKMFIWECLKMRNFQKTNFETAWCSLFTFHFLFWEGLPTPLFSFIFLGLRVFSSSQDSSSA